MDIGNVPSIDLTKHFDYVAKDNSLLDILYITIWKWKIKGHQKINDEKREKLHLQWKGKLNQFTWCCVEKITV